MRIHEGVNWRILWTLVCKDCRNKMFMRKVIIVTVLLGFAVAHSYAGICATCHALANLQGAAQQTSAFGVYSERLAATQNNCDSQAVCALASTAAAPASPQFAIASGAGAAVVPHQPMFVSWAIAPLLPPPKRAV